MRTRFSFGEVAVDRIVEGEYPLASVFDFFPTLMPDVLSENRGWMQPTALDGRDWLVLCIQSYVLRTPRHTILVDSCVGNDKTRRRRSGT
jgi:hypothetical protein